MTFFNKLKPAYFPREDKNNALAMKNDLQGEEK